MKHTDPLRTPKTVPVGDIPTYSRKNRDAVASSPSGGIRPHRFRDVQTMSLPHDPLGPGVLLLLQAEVCEWPLHFSDVQYDRVHIIFSDLLRPAKQDGILENA